MDIEADVPGWTSKYHDYGTVSTDRRRVDTRGVDWRVGSALIQPRCMIQRPDRLQSLNCKIAARGWILWQWIRSELSCNSCVYCMTLDTVGVQETWGKQLIGDQSPRLAGNLKTESSTGCEFRSGSSSGCVFWCTAVFTEQLRCTSPTASVVLPTSTVVAVSVRSTRRCWLSRRRAVQHLAIARSQWLRQERGTDCLRLSELRRHLCLFARSWRRFFSGGALSNFSSLDTHYSVNVFKLAPYSARLRHISILTVKCPCNVFAL